MLAPQYRIPLFLGCIMLLLGFVGVILTDVKKDGAWSFWLYIVAFYAVLSLGYHLFSKGGEKRSALSTFWHEVFHWVGLFLCILLISFMVKIGIVSRFLASLEILTLLALTTYLIGVYFDKIFIPIGIVLGLFVAALSFFDQYLYLIVIPLIAIALGLIFWIVRGAHKSTIE